MLYRHFPKIANTEFSILAISLAELRDESREEDLILRAAEHGINLIYTGADPNTAKSVEALLEKNGLAETVFTIASFRGSSAEELESFIDDAKPARPDFLLMHVTDVNSVDRLRITGISAAACRLRNAGKIGYIGFYVPPVSAVINAAVDNGPEWDFWATRFNYLHYNIADSVRHASDAELALVAFDPFEDGRLENPPNSVHELFRDAPVPRSRDEWALRSIWEKQDIATVVWEPASPEDIFRKAILAEAGRANSLQNKELAVLKAAAKEMEKENGKNA